MSGRSFRTLDVAVEPVAPPEYRVRVVAAHASGRPQRTVRLDPQADPLAALVRTSDPHTADERSAREAATTLGAVLFEALLGGEVGALWRRELADARRSRASVGVRLRLRFDGTPELEALPWELMYDRELDTFPARSPRTPLVRYVDVPAEPRPLHVKGALRVLLVLASPTGLPELDVDRERRAVEAAATSAPAGTMTVELLPRPTVEALDDWLAHQDVHVVHVIAHGGVESGSAVVYLADAYGRPEAVTAERLGLRLGAHDPLRLVVLNACDTTGAGDDGGFARLLVRSDVADVVAMQRVVSDQAAATFAAALYSAVAQGIPLDQAVAGSRVSMADGGGLEWATPVLFMRSPDGRLFDQSPGSAADPNADLGRRRAELETLVATGSVSAAKTLGDLLALDVSPPDLTGASAAYRLALEGEVHGAAGALGYLLVQLQDPADLDEGRRLLEQGTAEGDADAANTLGFLLSNRLSPPDLVAARRAYERATAAGHPLAANNLGVLLLTQWDPPDREAARRAFEAAVAVGNPRGSENLAAMGEG